jgi:hypothetical protein
MKRILLTILFLIIPQLLYSQVNSFSLLNEKTITSKEISESGITRLSDIFLLIDDWYFSSINGYEYQAYANGLSSFQEELWILMIDGQRMDNYFFQNLSINNLQMEIGDIDYIEIIDVPQIVDSEFADAGLIHIHTKKNKDGFSIIGKGQIGSETGDQGPDRYVIKKNINVDHYGEDISLVAKYKYNPFYINVGYSHQLLAFTNTAYLKRISAITPGEDWPSMQVYLPFMKIGYETSTAKNEIFALRSQYEGYYFFKPFGNEIPVNNTYLHLGSIGDFQIGKSTKLNYKLKYSTNEFYKANNIRNIDFAWKYENIYANLEYNKNSVKDNYDIGIGINRYKTISSSVSDNSYYLGKLYSSLSSKIGNDFSYNLGLFFEGNSDELTIKSFASTHYKIDKKNQISGNVSFAKRILEEGDNFWFWTERGYNFLNENNIPYTIQEELEGGNQITLDIIFNSKINDNLGISLSGKVRRLLDIYLIQQNFLYDPVNETLSSPILIQTDQEGTVIGGGIAVEHKPFDFITHKLSYNYITSLNKDNLFGNLWKRVPEHKLRFSVFFTPVESFSINGNLNYFSGTDWIEYNDIDTSSNGKFSSKLNDYLSLDLAVKKYFWAKKIRASLILQNVFNRENRLHPIGKKFLFSFFL